MTVARHDVHQWAGEDPDRCIVCDVSWSDADLTCTPLAGRAICPEMNADWGCLKDKDHDGKHWSISHGVEVEWDPINWAAEQAELDELERTDPDVAAAAASYDRMVERVRVRLAGEDFTLTREQADSLLPTKPAHADREPTAADWATAAGLFIDNRPEIVTPPTDVERAIVRQAAHMLAAQRAEIHTQRAAVYVAARQLDTAVTAYMLGDLGGAGVGRAQHELRDALRQVRDR